MSGASIPRPASAATACWIPAADSWPAAQAAPGGGEPPAPAAARPATPAAATSTPSDPARRAASMDTR
eukprot:6121960-Alexandrium_andersonii.AAC.1